MKPVYESGQMVRLFYPDAIRAFSIIAIVFLHVSSPIAQDFAGYRLSWWWIANVIYSCARPSIALFVMISGLLLLSPKKDEGLSFFIRKRLLRIGVPFLAWAAVYFVWKNHGHLSYVSIIQFTREIITGPVYYHLWFIYTIAGIYLATPIFRVYVKNASRSNQLYLLVLWFFGTAVYPLIKHFTGISIGIPIMVAGGFLGTFLLGNYLRDLAVGKRMLVTMWVVFIVCWAFTALATFFLSAHAGAYNGLYEDFLCPNVIVMAICGFFIVKSTSRDTMKTWYPALQKIMTTISSVSFSVYLMHILVLEIFKSHVPWFSLDACTIHPLIGIPLTVFVTLFLCAGLTVSLRKIPFVKYVLP